MKPCSASPLEDFHPVIRQWFSDRFAAPTDAQQLGWPAIRARQHTLIAAPTGSGKTLAAFLVCIDRLIQQWERNELADRPSVVYVSPLKALSNDIHRNLEEPLTQICEAAAAWAGRLPPPIRAAIRTGDTPAVERQRMLRRPPHIVVTTPESLYLLLTSVRGREILRGVETVIVDEIHALARDKRGSHLSLTLARLDALCDLPPTRIGLSATQRPMDEIARFLVGTRHVASDGTPTCQIVDVGHAREMELAIEVPPTDLEAVCSTEQWSEVYERLVQLMDQHRSTLVFVNTRRMAERVAHRLTERLGEDAVASHHGSLSRELRHSAERRLKSGQLKAIVATASLEMGIDVGYIDLVCQIGSPRSIATFLQRVGRSGHRLSAIPRGMLFPLTRDELLECMALIRAIRRGRLDTIEIPQAPLDILAQQIVAEVASRDCQEEELFELCRSAWPYHHVSRETFADIIRLLCEGISPTSRIGRHLHRDAVQGRLRARRGARLTAITSGGAIPEMAQFRVVTVEDETYVGEVEEDFAIDSNIGDIFLLGNNSWQIVRVHEGQVLVKDVHGAPPNIPFWFGEAPGRTYELSEELSQLRQDLCQRLPDEASDPLPISSENLAWLARECGSSERASRQALRYIAAQKMSLGVVPHARQIVFERFFDESGGMQLVIHAPFGSRINRAWGLALRKRFCRSFDFELQAAATDDGILLSIGPQHSFPIESLFRIVHPDNAKYLLEQAILAVPMFQVRWRWNATRALSVHRFRGGKKVPFYLQRYRADDLLAVVFPETVGCLENHEGDVKIPEHPLVQQTVTDCLQEAMDVRRWIDVLQDMRTETISVLARETREPSPFSHQLIHANPYAFLDGAGLDERRTRAVMTRKGLPLEQLQNLARLDPVAIDQVVRDAAPVVRDADELHDLLLDSLFLKATEVADWHPWLEELAAAGRIVPFRWETGGTSWSAVERWHAVRSLYPTAGTEAPPDQLAATESTEISASDALVELLRGRLARSGPVTVAELGELTGLAAPQLNAALEALEATGNVMRGHYRPSNGDDAVQWCDRRLLARIHRLTVDQLRQQIQPVSRDVFVRYALRRQGAFREKDDIANGKDKEAPEHSGVREHNGAREHLGTSALPWCSNGWTGTAAVREVIALLQGLEIPAGGWESHVLPARIANYDPAWLDQLFATGELMWGRLRPPRALDDVTDRRLALRLNRSIPMSLILREDLDWLLLDGHRMNLTRLRSNARIVYDVLAECGALFTQQLRVRSGLLNAQLEEALRELAAAGLVTCDSFAAVRQLIARPRAGRRRPRRGMETAPGRWSLFPGDTRPPNQEERIQHWCQQLLRRWGVVFRDLLVREPVAPPWHELVRAFRKLEYRGEIRGGRFILGVAGEQFATSEAVQTLRKVRDIQDRQPWIVLSAVDPLNMVGVLDSTLARIPVAVSNSLAYAHGRCIAWQVAGEITLGPDVPHLEAGDIRRALLRGTAQPSDSDATTSGQRAP